jgi:hypothetical protein
MEADMAISRLALAAIALVSVVSAGVALRAQTTAVAAPYVQA